MGGDKTRIIKHLIRKDNVQIQELMIEFHLTKLEVRETINKINDSFSKDVIISSGQAVYMTEAAKMLCYKKFFREKGKLFSHHEFETRYNLIIIVLAVEKKYLSLLELADICLVSKNTILNDMKLIKQDLDQKEIDVDYSRKHGYVMKGREFAIRNLLVTAVKDVLRSLAGRILLEEKNLVDSSKIFRLRKRLERVESRIGITLTDEQLDELPYIIHFVIRRAKKLDTKWSFKIEKYDIKNTVEFPEIREMFWDYDFLTQSDLLYLSLQVLASNMVESALAITDGDEVSEATDKFIDNIEANLAMHMHRRNELKNKVLLHMRPAIYRSLLGFQINNPLTREFLDQYHEIYYVVKKSVKPFQNIIHRELSTEEIVYLCMIVLSWIYEAEETETIFKAVVLCQSGTSISKLLLVTLQAMFPEIDFIGAYSVRQFEQDGEEVDFIFTTVPINDKRATFIVPPILDRQTRIDLRNRVQGEMRNNSDPLVRSLMKVIQPYIPNQYIDVVSRKVCCLLAKQNASKVQTDNGSDQFKFSIDNISIVKESIDWKELVDISMFPLFRRNSITQQYINKTKKIFYSNYDRMLIAENVYLPHVAAKFGVKKMDFQIVVLKKPAFTPNGEEVKIVVALAPSVENDHVPTLIKLNNLFMDKNVMCQIMKEENIFTIQSMLNSLGGAEDEFCKFVSAGIN